MWQLGQVLNKKLTKEGVDNSPFPWYNRYRKKREGNNTMKNIYTINVKRNTANLNNYANANKFLRSIIVTGEEAMQARVQELRNAGAEIESIYNGIGDKIAF